MALVCTIEQDRELGRQVIAMTMKTINGPIKKGHVPFAHDLARAAVVYDFCHEYWTAEERTMSPSKPAVADYFLHVLTATDATVETVPAAALEETDDQVRIRVGKATIAFEKNNVGGSVEMAGHRRPFPDGILESPLTN